MGTHRQVAIWGHGEKAIKDRDLGEAILVASLSWSSSLQTEENACLLFKTVNHESVFQQPWHTGTPPASPVINPLFPFPVPGSRHALHTPQLHKLPFPSGDPKDFCGAHQMWKAE